MVLLMSTPVRIALSFEIDEIKLYVVCVIEPSAHIATATNVSPKFLHAAPTRWEQKPSLLHNN